MNNDYDRYFSLLKDALTENGVSLIGISLGDFADDSLCVERKGEKWMVYSAERGNKFDVSEHDSILDACYDVIHRVSESDVEEENIKHYFSNFILSLRNEPDVLEKYEEAIADYSKAIMLKPDLAEAYYHRGIVYYDLRKYDEAIADYTKAIALKPDLAEAYYHRGIAYYAIGHYQRVKEDIYKQAH